MEIQRDSDLFKAFIKNYWEYLRELEGEFLQTRKYVEFCEENNATFSIEYLKLYQAVCSEIDVVGKAMAKVANDSFKPDDKQNNIYKWWFEIQDVFLLTDGPFTYMNPNARAARFSLTDYKCLLVDEIEIQPWSKFRVEKALNKNGGTYYRVVPGFQVPGWWSDYNKVKHNRMLSVGNESNSTNYPKANFKNLYSAFAALYVLEKALMDTIGTEDDLSCFMDFSSLFVHRKKLTFKQMDELYKNI